MRPISVTKFAMPTCAALAPRRVRADEESASLRRAGKRRLSDDALDEGGKSSLVCRNAGRTDQKALGRPCFIIGGPYGNLGALGSGIHKAARDYSQPCQALPGRMRILARVPQVLEQIYRASAFVERFPHHHH